MPHNHEWYNGLKKSPLSPPDWVFSITWSLLYLMISLSLIIYLQATGILLTTGLIYFLVQMMANLVWYPLFFMKKMIKIAFVDSILLWIFIILTILEFKEINMTATCLLMPYCVWIGIAIYLQAYILLNNPSKSKEEKIDWYIQLYNYFITLFGSNI